MSTGYRKSPANVGLVCAVNKYYLSKQVADECPGKEDDPLFYVAMGLVFICVSISPCTPYSTPDG